MAYKPPILDDDIDLDQLNDVSNKPRPSSRPIKEPSGLLGAMPVTLESLTAPKPGAKDRPPSLYAYAKDSYAKDFSDEQKWDGYKAYDIYIDQPEIKESSQEPEKDQED